MGSILIQKFPSHLAKYPNIFQFFLQQKYFRGQASIFSFSVRRFDTYSCWPWLCNQESHHKAYPKIAWIPLIAFCTANWRRFYARSLAQRDVTTPRKTCRELLLPKRCSLWIQLLAAGGRTPEQNQYFGRNESIRARKPIQKLILGLDFFFNIDVKRIEMTSNAK